MEQIVQTPQAASDAPWNSANELLESLGLSRYAEAFEREALDVATLTLAKQHGKDALDDALKEVGVISIGHRLKIMAALK